MCEGGNYPRLPSSRLYFRKYIGGATYPFSWTTLLASPDSTEGQMCATRLSPKATHHQTYYCLPQPTQIMKCNLWKKHNSLHFWDARVAQMVKHPSLGISSGHNVLQGMDAHHCGASSGECQVTLPQLLSIHSKLLLPLKRQYTSGTHC